MLSIAEAGSADELQRARTELLRAQIAFSSNIGSDAPPLLVSAARRLERLDPELARETYLDAWGAAMFAGRLAAAAGLVEVSRAARAAPAPAQTPHPSDLLLDALALLITEGRTAAAAALRRASEAFAATDDPAENQFRWTWLPPVPSYVLWDDEGWYVINARQLQLARDAGALARVPMGLITQAVSTHGRASSQALRPQLHRPKRSPRRPGSVSRPTERCCSPLSRVGKPTARICSSLRSTPPLRWAKDSGCSGGSS